MAFDKKFFQPIGATSRSGLEPTSLEDEQSSAEWSYEHPTDDFATIVATGYFNEIRDIVNTHDVLYLSTSSTTDFQINFFDVVPKSPSPANVTISALAIVAAV